MAPSRDPGPPSPAPLHAEAGGAVQTLRRRPARTPALHGTGAPTVTALLVNGEPRPLPEPPSVAGALAALGLTTRPVAVEVNGQLIRRPDHAGARLEPGDRVEIVSFVGGG